MPTSPATYVACSINFQWPGFASTRAAVADGRVLPWSRRLPLHVATIKGSGASVVMAQELGHDEATQVAEGLGEDWRYQRNGLCVVLWRPDWTLEEEPGREPVSRDWQLPAYGQLAAARTLIAVRLRHRTTGQYFFAASAHLASSGSWGVGSVTSANARFRQATVIGKRLDRYSAILLGADLNSRGTLPGTPRQVLQSAGWTFTEPASLSGDAKHGIDAVAAKRRVTVQSVAVLPLGEASDHSGRRVTFSIANPATKE